ncbi:MAG: ABC transporter ATP-binding protein, partial [Halodesulfurarchaeum sp.]
MLSGLETPTEGEVYIDGEQVTGKPPYERDTSIVFQSWALFPNKTVLENVAFGLKMDGMEREDRIAKARRVLDIVEMEALEDSLPEELSGGQKQRVALARSLAIEPSVILLDEPLSNLDKRLREQMQIELRNIQNTVETTFVHVTHDQDEAFTLADRIGIMNDGQLEQVGEPREVYDTPENRFVEEFLGESNILDGTLEERRDWGVSIELDLGKSIVVPPLQDGLSPGDPLTVSLRPEVLTVDPIESRNEESDSAPSTGVTGTITDVLYRGGSVRFFVEVGDGSVFFEQSIGAETDFEVGDRIVVGWEPSDLLVFAEGERIGMEANQRDPRPVENR